MGAYRFDDGRLVSIRRSEGETLRARFYDSGDSRRLYPRGKLRFATGSSFASAEPVEATIEFWAGEDDATAGLTWTPQGSPGSSARKVNRSRRILFESDGAVLSGRLDLPSGTSGQAPSTAVVLLHGSGSSVATEFFYNGDFLAANGIAALTYDKRGTGDSEGRATFDFHQLARDAKAAVDYLSSHEELRDARVGFSGYSQGAWIDPPRPHRDRVGGCSAVLLLESRPGTTTRSTFSRRSTTSP